MQTYNFSQLNNLKSDTIYKNKENLSKFYTILVLECEKQNQWENFGDSWMTSIEKYKEGILPHIGVKS